MHIYRDRYRYIFSSMQYTDTCIINLYIIYRYVYYMCMHLHIITNKQTNKQIKQTN